MKKYRSVEEFERDLKNECRKYLTTFAIEYCSKAADELTNTAKYAIEEFYRDYNPNWYDRTNNLKDNSYKRYYKNHGKRVIGGVYIGSDYMDNYYKKTKNGLIERDPFLVASTAWESGLHGIYGWHTEDGKNGVVPIDIVNKKMKDKKFLENLEESAYKKAMSQNYEILSYILK